MTGSGPSRHRTSEEGFGGEGKATLSIAESYTRRCRTHLFAITIMLSRSYPAVSSLVPCSSQSVRGVACAAAATVVTYQYRPDTGGAALQLWVVCVQL